MNLRSIVLALTVLAASGESPIRSAQATAPRAPFQTFEVATIKPTAPEEFNGGRYMRMQSAHQFQAKNVSVSGLISAAYDLSPRMTSGGPPWLERDRYDLTAATPGELRPSYDDQMRMLRKLLADRFNLKFHRARKEFAIYEVSVAKGGPKLKDAIAQPDEPSNETSTLHPAASGGVDYVQLPARNITLQHFAAVLQRAILDRPVVDHTGIAGRFDFDLEWTPDSSQFGGQLPLGPPESGKPGLFTALPEQLGLKIEATRGLIETLVIDHLDRPSNN